ncbi:MAG: Bifunctional NAD(P)H-hydrate repair enzyme Nnr [candidate division WS6 bacterium OLB20]|uniref:Bifunctional NAD(P)H-hydrate repair enzyme n=1 Tax=candidate division WS6 bacterium OLB20 TaxID=1617426 RepID=A0A136M073_9BACT|nr:MAG: Bifunctional NAD(P)H-hydrate repair enzyme Nnr [candidate division WS6 bacterium OLB20]
MKILTAAQRKDADNFTIAGGTPEQTLIERAAKAVSEYLISRCERGSRIQIYCGQGNNGADGLAVARLLKKRAYDPRVFIVNHRKDTSKQFSAQAERLRAMQTVPVYELTDQSTLPEHNKDTIIVDALLGSGISGAVADDSLLATVITHINSHEGLTVSIDVPSGMLMDERTDGIAVAADHVITFERPPLAFLLRDNEDFVGSFDIAHTGISHKFMEELPGQFYWTTREVAGKLLRTNIRRVFSDKRDYGHSYIIAGAKGTYGAAVLAARGALVAGSGKVSARVPAAAHDILLNALPEVMVLADGSKTIITDSGFDPDRFTVTGIGPGIGTHHDTAEMLEDLLARSELDTKLVLDADALNILADEPEMLDMLPPGTVLTPHAGEFERLAGSWRDGFELLDALQGFVATHNITVVLKGHYTMVALASGQVHFNSSGNPGMATAGTGDALLGIITGLIAQGWSPEEAAILGAYIHGLAGDIAAQKHSQLAMRASDLLDEVGAAFMNLNVQE